MVKLITLVMLTSGASVGTFVGKFWLYDRELECDFRDDIKNILTILDILKDTAIYFMLLSYLLK